MNKTFVYSSIFAPYIELFIHEKELQGYKMTQLKWILLEFDRFMEQIKKDNLFISSADIRKWIATRTNDKPTTLYQKHSAIANFCRFMSLLGYECYIPTLPRNRRSNYSPTIFTHEQVSAIFKVCDKMVMKEHHANSIMIIMPSLLRLLYSTGIRISEALSILNKDVLFERKAIVLNNTKNGYQRLAPINDSLEGVLRQYISYRSRIPFSGTSHPQAHFFVSTSGKPCSRRTALTYFHRIIHQCGIPRCSNQRGPMIHEIRHTSAVHALVKLTQSGQDVYTSLPLLAAFLGHKKVLDSENYIRLTQEMYPDLMHQNADVSDYVYAGLLSINPANHESAHN